ncbi:MAG: PspC domain-containing protein [Prevotella sp.]|nr:PspC domain-containing protein [Prevotella sp.]MDO4934886.1 PspC domain-containing protein [Prevotella sp.]
MKRFYLSSNDRKIGGVCGGLAEYFDIDPLIVRIAVFALIWCGTVGIWLYLLIWLLAPRNYNF